MHGLDKSLAQQLVCAYLSPGGDYVIPELLSCFKLCASFLRDEAGDKHEAQEEKYSAGEMIWGGVCARGLVPKDASIFIVTFIRNMSHHIQRPSMALCMYADLIREIASPAIMFDGCILLAMLFSKMMEPLYTAVLLL